MIYIKRYANRKLYNTDTKQYITLDGIGELIREGTEIQILDHESGMDITSIVLTQIILGNEKKGSGLFSKGTLTRLIQAGEDRVTEVTHTLFPNFLIERTFQRELQNRISKIVKHGLLSEEEGLDMFALLTAQASVLSPKQSAEATLEEEIKEHAEYLHSEVANLMDRIDALVTEIDALKNHRQ